MEQPLSALDKLVDRVLETAAGRDPYDPVVIRAHAAAIALYRDFGLPEQVEAAYDRFRATCPAGGDPRFPWSDRFEMGSDFWSETHESLNEVLDIVIEVKELRHPSDRSEIEFLDSLRERARPALTAVPNPPVFEVPMPPAAELERVDGALARILDVLPIPADRQANMLRIWQGVTCLGRYRFHDLLDRLQDVAPDDGALGILARTLVGEAQYRLADYEDAHQSLRHAGELAETILARAPGSGARASGSRQFIARLAQKEGNALYYIGDDKLAQAAYERARHFASDDPLAEATYLVNLGNLDYLRNNLVDQRGYVTLDWAEMHALTKQGPAALQAIKIQRNVASLIEAESHYQAALDRLISRRDGTSQTQNLIATVYINLGNAAWAWARVLEGADADCLEDLPLGDDWNSTLITQDATRADCYRAAIAQQKQALEFADEGPALEATAWSNLSELYFLLAEQTGDPSDLEQGVATGQRAMALIGDYVADGNAALLASQGTYLPEGVWRTAYNLARLHEALGDHEVAGQYYASAIEALEAMRAMIRLDTWQATFLQDKLEAYEGYIRFLYHLDPEEYKTRIFELFEMMKARAFLDLLDSARLDIGVDEKLLAQRDDLLARIAAGNEDIRRAIVADDQAQVAVLREQQQAFAQAWKEVQSQIAAAQQADGDLNPPLISLSTFQAFLRDQDAVVLSFVVGQRTSYLMVVNSTNAHVFELPGRHDVELAVTELLWYCQQNSRQSFAEFRAANVRVVELLLSSADAELNLKDYLAGRQVVITPDGVLFYLPFEALLIDDAHLTELGDEADFTALRPYYLIAHSDGSYAPSASAWVYLAAQPPEPSQTSIMGVYNINYDVDEPHRPAWALSVLAELRNLPGTQQVERILEEFKAAWPDQDVVHVRAWRGNQEPEAPEFQSTEDNFLRLVPARTPRYVVFSGHAVYNDKYPSLSGLIFNLAPLKNVPDTRQQEGVGRQDGFLRLGEIFRLPMRHTELTFLAACQTGLGVVYRGEGLTALTRAFMYRGSPSVIASLWAVSDNATQFLTRQFFELLLAQPDADRAHLLAEAKRQVMKHDRYSLPWYWAPFILTGVHIPTKKGQQNG